MKARVGSALLAAAAVVVTACGVFVAPEPTPGELTDVVSALVRRGATVSDQIAGDTGCGDQTLFGNAVRFDVRMPNETAATPVYLFRWKNQATFDATEAPFDACRVAYSEQHPQSTLSFVEAAPWRAYGPDWSPELNAAINQALEAAAGS